MWKKDDMPETGSTPRQETGSGYERSTPPRAAGERATIGRSITINGEVSGDEDLLIQGRVDGSVNLKQHSVTVGPEGEVRANITARVVMVDGRVEGNIKAEEQVVLRGSAVVEGDVAAPRVVLEDGARFRGGVDMGETLDRARGATSQSSAAARPATGSDAQKAGTATGEEKAAGVKSGTPQAAAPGASR